MWANGLCVSAIVLVVAGIYTFMVQPSFSVPILLWVVSNDTFGRVLAGRCIALS
jgi:hypothetical protein